MCMYAMNVKRLKKIYQLLIIIDQCESFPIGSEKIINIVAIIYV